MPPQSPMWAAPTLMPQELAFIELNGWGREKRGRLQRQELPAAMANPDFLAAAVNDGLRGAPSQLEIPVEFGGILWI